jgi:hypothetical protein
LFDQRVNKNLNIFLSTVRFLFASQISPICQTPDEVYDKKVAAKTAEVSLRGGRRPTKQSQGSALRLLRCARNDMPGHLPRICRAPAIRSRETFMVGLWMGGGYHDG